MILCESAVSCRLINFYRAAIRQLREEWDFDEEECEKMGMSFLQKVARSGCYVKSDYAIDRMMEARHWRVQILVLASSTGSTNKKYRVFSTSPSHPRLSRNQARQEHEVPMPACPL